MSTLRSLNPTAYFQANFRLVDKVNFYSRVVYRMIDLVADVGGASHIVFVIGEFIVSILATRLFYASLIRDTFRVRLDTGGADISQLLK